MFSSADEAKEVEKCFRNAFEIYKKEPIILYGLGVNTRVLLNTLKDYNIIGVMDAKHEGEEFEGKHIYSEEEVKNIASIIVIIARATVVPIIYNRIKHLESDGIVICNVRGEKLNKAACPDSDLQQVVSADTIKNSILEHDVICFDIFDTLIARKVVEPEDIFKIVERRLKKRGVAIDFYELRKTAAHIAYKKRVSPTLKDIYFELNNLKNLKQDVLDEIMEEEIQTELEYIVPRESIISFMKYAKENNKKVCLVSEMYLDALQIKRLLDRCGIKDYDELFVSCMCGKNKWPQGDLFEEVKTKNVDRSILHIGDNQGADVECALIQGVDAVQVLSNYEIMVQSPFRTLLSYNRNLGDSIAIGIFAARYLSDPFELAKNKGRLFWESKSDVGFGCYGPLVVGFLVWIKRQCGNNGLKNIAFMARDGWIFERVWKLFSKFYAEIELPKAEYILGSRRALAVPAIRNDQDIKAALQKVPESMSNYNMLLLRFGIDSLDVDVNDEREECVYKRKEEILANSERERKIYNQYIDSNFVQKEKVAVVDLVSAGTIGKYFFQTTEREGSLLCLLKSNVPDYSVCDEIESYAYMGEDNKYAPKWLVHKYVGELEGVLTAPTPMFICFDEAGTEQYSNCKISEEKINALQEIHRGITEYAMEIFSLSPDFEMLEFTPELCDTFFGLLYETDLCFIAGIKENLKATNDF